VADRPDWVRVHDDKVADVYVRRSSLPRPSGS
jgi:hypothetical protein